MDAPGTFARKHSVQGAKWNAKYEAQLHDYVANVNYLTGHAYAFARYILLQEVDIKDYVIFKMFGSGFFYDAFLYCAERKDEREVGDETKARRAVILSYRDAYVKLSGLKLKKYEPLSEVASYISKTMVTAYTNNVMQRFGETWRRAINLKFDSEEEKKKLEQHLRDIKTPEPEIQQQFQTQIRAAARQAKEVMRYRRPVPTTEKEREIIDFLSPVLGCHPVGYKFKGDDIYWDAKTSPEMHVKAFIMLNKCLVAGKYKCIQALPLRRTWVYAHVPINTVILANHIFEEEYRPVIDKKPAVLPGEPVASSVESSASSGESSALPSEPAALPDEPAALPDEPATSSGEPAASSVESGMPAEEYWSRIVDMTKSFKDHPLHMFTGYVMTDGVSITVIRKNKEMLAAKAADLKRKREEPAQEQPAAQRARLAVPVAETTVPSYPQVSLYALVPSQQMSMLPQYARPPSQLPPMSSQEEQQLQECLSAEHAWQVLLSTLPVQPARLLAQQLPVQQPPAKKVQPCRSAQPKADCQYIDDLSQATLQSMAGRCVLIDPGRRDLLFAMHEDSSVEKSNKETRQTKFKQIREKAKKADTEDIAALERTLGAGSCVKPNLKLFEEYLEARKQVADELTRFYNKTDTVHPTSTHQIHEYKPKSEVRAFPLHRKLQQSAYVNRKQADQRLGKKLRKEFGPDAVIVIGDWSAPMARFHEPIRGKSWRMLLKRAGFDVYLIKEYLTSKTCPNCNGGLANTRYVPNPRPWMCTKRPMVKCHGLLSCESEKCLESIGKCEDESEGEKEEVKKWWNRDLAAVLNFRHILFSLRETGIAPARFKRKQQQPTEAPKTRKRKQPAEAPKTTALGKITAMQPAQQLPPGFTQDIFNQLPVPPQQAPAPTQAPAPIDPNNPIAQPSPLAPASAPQPASIPAGLEMIPTIASPTLPNPSDIPTVSLPSVTAPSPILVPTSASVSGSDTMSGSDTGSGTASAPSDTESGSASGSASGSDSMSMPTLSASQSASHSASVSGSKQTLSATRPQASGSSDDFDSDSNSDDSDIDNDSSDASSVRYAAMAAAFAIAASFF
ncbi:hypothetical protein GGH96_001458 [Coemansia sp. RSA 1972]|nr:hypothetical protein GGH96_001458 [Coemansia sp. RSA 1972]